MNFRTIFFILLIYMLSIPLAAMQKPEEDVSKARLLMSNHRWVQMHYFFQGGLRTQFNDDATTGDYFIDHNRLIFNGQTAENFYFFVQSEDFTADQNSEDGGNKMFTQDAYMHFKPADEAQLYVGLMPIPLSRANLLSAATTLTTSLNRHAIPFSGYSNNGRDIGFMLRGFLFSAVVDTEYRVGIFEGRGRETGVYNSDDENPDNDISYTRNDNSFPRMTTRIQLHIIDREEGMFYSENYLGKRDVFTFGLGFDFQPDVADTDQDGTFDNYFAIAADTDIQVAMGGGNASAIQLGIVYSNNNPAISDTYPELDYNDQLHLYGQAGILLTDSYQPFARYGHTTAFSADDGKNFTFSTLSLGSNYYFDAHHANARLQYDIPFGDNRDMDGEHTITAQMQIYL